MPRPDKPNETTNTAGGINTPASREDNAATDPIAGAVEAIMDNLQHAVQVEDGKRANRRTEQ